MFPFQEVMFGSSRVDWPRREGGSKPLEMVQVILFVSFMKVVKIAVKDLKDPKK